MSYFFDFAIGVLLLALAFLIFVLALSKIDSNDLKCTNLQIHSIIEKSASCKSEAALLKQWDCVDLVIKRECR